MCLLEMVFSISMCLWKDRSINIPPPTNFHTKVIYITYRSVL